LSSFFAPFVLLLASGFDEKGRPMRVPGKVATPEGSFIIVYKPDL
jgi:hypothetical protein